MWLSRFYTAFILASMALFTVVKQEQVRVDPEVTAYLGDSVTLCCEISSDIRSTFNVTQWQWGWESPNRTSETIAVFNPQHGLNYHNATFNGRVKFIHPSILYNPSISITHVNKKDEGRYTCEFTTFPSGILKATTALTVLDKPPISYLSAVGATGIGLVILLVIVILFTVVCVLVRRRRHNASTQSSTIHCMTQSTIGEDQVLNYADISHFRKVGSGTMIKSRVDDEVIYAQVKRN